jgi:D-sedoheptulose 7-phosphate isomerase
MIIKGSIMNNIDTACNGTNSFPAFFQEYINYLSTILVKIDFISLDDLCKEFESARENGNTIFIAGNGGSATTASTMANDLGFGIIKKTGTDNPFRVLALTDNNSMITAIGNDVGYEDIFINQLRIHFRKGDKLIVISVSGNSPNLIKAAKWVKSECGNVIGLLGFDGGELKALCDVAVHINTQPGEYGPTEDVHLIINHVLAHWFQNRFKKDK